MRPTYFLQAQDARGFPHLACIDLMPCGEGIFPFPNCYLISRVSTPFPIRRKGHANHLFSLLLSDADKEQATLILEIMPGIGAEMQHEELAEWYSRKGFRPYSPFPFAWSAPVMLRLPRQEGAALAQQLETLNLHIIKASQ